MLRRVQIPRDQLTVDAATDDHFGVLRRELDGRNLNGCLQGILGEDHLAVVEVQDEHLGLK